MIAWLASQLKFFNMRLSPLEIIDTERRYPGLLNALNIEFWQQEIIRQQVKSEGADTDNEG